MHGYKTMTISQNDTQVIDMPIKQGATFRLGLNFQDRFKQPYDLTGFRAHIQIRDPVDGKLVHDLSTENGGIVLNATPGDIDLYISSATTAAMQFTTGAGAADFFLLYPNGDRDFLFAFKVSFEEAQTINE